MKSILRIVGVTVASVMAFTALAQNSTSEESITDEQPSSTKVNSTTDNTAPKVHERNDHDRDDRDRENQTRVPLKPGNSRDDLGATNGMPRPEISSIVTTRVDNATRNDHDRDDRTNAVPSAQ